MISYIKTIYRKIRFMLRDFFINKNKWSNLKADRLVIVASDCTGGMLYHDLKKEFMSPTINLFFSATDYIKFLKNPYFYFNMEMEEIKQNEYEYPIAKLGDITLYLVHYKTVQDAQIKWRERSERFKENWGGKSEYVLYNE